MQRVPGSSACPSGGWLSSTAGANRLSPPAGVAQALPVLDFSAPSDPRRVAALAGLLASARARDALTLWHLLSRGTPEERAKVYDRLATLVPPPSSATREAVLRA